MPARKVKNEKNATMDTITVDGLMHPDTLLNVSQIASLLDCSPHTVYRLWARGTLKKHPTELARSRSRYADVVALNWIPQADKNIQRPRKPRPQTPDPASDVPVSEVPA